MILPRKNLEEWTLLFCTWYQKIRRNDVPSFSRKFEKLFWRLIWRCCNGKTHLTDQVIAVTNILQIIWNLFYKINYVFAIYLLSAIQVCPKTTVVPWLSDFSPEFILCIKTSAIKYKLCHNPCLLTLSGCVARRAGYMITQ